MHSPVTDFEAKSLRFSGEAFSPQSLANDTVLLFLITSGYLEQLLRKVNRFRMRPTKAQEAALYRMAGARRFVYNWALDRRKSYYAEHGIGISAKQLSSEFETAYSRVSRIRNGL